MTYLIKQDATRIRQKYHLWHAIPCKVLSLLRVNRHYAALEMFAVYRILSGACKAAECGQANHATSQFCGDKHFPKHGMCLEAGNVSFLPASGGHTTVSLKSNGCMVMLDLEKKPFGILVNDACMPLHLVQVRCLKHLHSRATQPPPHTTQIA